MRRFLWLPMALLLAAGACVLLLAAVAGIERPAPASTEPVGPASGLGPKPAAAAVAHAGAPDAPAAQRPKNAEAAAAAVPKEPLAPAPAPPADGKPRDQQGASPIELKTTETSVGRAANYTPSMPLVSPDHRHQMYMNWVNGKTYVALDGVPGKEGYDAVDGLRFSADGKRTAFTARGGGKTAAVVDGVAGPAADDVKELHFSADGRRVAYILTWQLPGTATMPHRAVIDGKAGPAYNGVWDVVFSPDGRHVAYVADRGTPLKAHVDSVVVLDGKEGESYDSILPGTLCFRPGSNRPSFLGTHLAQPRGVLTAVRATVIDGVEGAAADEIHFSPDGKRVATLLGGSHFARVTVDGQAGKTYDGTISNVLFSPDGRHLAYTVGGWDGNKAIVVVDGKEGTPYDEVHDFQFGPDGTRFAYLVRKGPLTEACVTDAGEEKGYVRVFEPFFSPDGKHVAYLAQRLDGSVVVRDGKEEKLYFQVLEHSLQFSPDGQRLAYMAMTAGGLGGGLRVVVDGVEGKGYGFNGSLPGLAFSPDGKRLAYVAARDDGTAVVVVDGVESPSFDRALEAPVVFDGPNRLHVLAVRGENLIRLEVEIR